MTAEQRAALEAQRAEAYTTMRSVLDRVGDEPMSSEDQAEYDAAETSFDAIDGTLARAKRAAERDRSTAERGADDPERRTAVAAETRAERFGAALETAERSDANRESFLRSDEYREAFVEGLLRRGLMGTEMAPEYRAALNLGTDTEGGFTAPVEFVRELLVESADIAVVRQFARVIQTAHGRDLEFPQLDTKGQAGWTNKEVLTDAEADALKSEPTFKAPIVVKAHPAQREVVTSKDLLQDSVFDVEGLIRELIAESFGELTSLSYWQGDGVGEPSGIIPGIGAGTTKVGAAGQTTTVTGDDLISVQHKIKRRYRQNARWYLNDSTLEAVRKLKDNDGNYLWKPGLTDSEPGRILGKPYEVDEYVPDMAAGAKSIVFGDLSGYLIRDVLALSITRLVETYARRRQVGFLADMRTDGVLLRPERVAAYEHPAT